MPLAHWYACMQSPLCAYLLAAQLRLGFALASVHLVQSLLVSVFAAASVAVLCHRRAERQA